MPKRYTHILFDNDGVLVDSEHYYYQATAEGLASLGVTLSQERYVSAYMPTGKPPWHLAAEQGASEAAIAEAKQWRDARYIELLTTEPIEIEGVGNVLAILAPHVRMAVVTTSAEAPFEQQHAESGLLAHMDFALTRSAYEHSKPYPDPYLMALSRFGIGASDALVVEDSQRGLRSALAAGIDCAVVTNHFTAEQDFTGATYRIDSLAELPVLVDIA